MEQEILIRVDKIVEAVVNVAPHVWDAFYRQAFVKAITITAALIVSVGVFYWSVRTLTTKPQWSKNYDAECGVGLLALLSGVSILAHCIGFLLEGLPRLLNPTYYAIKELIPSL